MLNLFKLSLGRKLAAYVDAAADRINDKYELEIRANVRLVDRKPETTIRDLCSKHPQEDVDDGLGFTD